MRRRPSHPEPHSGTLSHRGAWTIALTMLAAMLLSACHPLINPLDPNSTTYTGPTGGSDTGDPPPPLLPSPARWELVTDHIPGRLLPLEITEDGSFVEPRDAGWFELWITLSDTFERKPAENAILWIAVTDATGTFYAVGGIQDVAPEQRRLGVRFDMGIPNETRIALRLTDQNGTVIGERELGRLIGDTNGSGTVEVVQDHNAISDLTGFAVSTDNPDTIRVDLDLNGLIEPNPGNDWNVINGHFGESLPAAADAFWD